MTKWAGLEAFDKALQVYEATKYAGTEAAMKDAVRLIETEGKAKASGRPGPRVVTGELRGSIHSDVKKSGRYAFVGKVGPSDWKARVVSKRDGKPFYPFMAPARKAVRQRLPILFKRRWR